MLWVPGLNDLNSNHGYLPNVSMTSVCCGFLGWMTYILTLVCAQCFQHQGMLWVPGLNDLHSNHGYLPNVSRTSVCCGFLGWMTYILTLVCAQCFQHQYILWVPGLDVLHSDAGICPMVPVPVYVVGSWAEWPIFWPRYLANVSRTSVYCGILGWMTYILTLVSAQCFQDKCMLWVPRLTYILTLAIYPMVPVPVYVLGS